MASVIWFQGGACSGNTMSFLNAAEPSVVDLIVDFGLEVVYHPTLSMEIGKAAQDIFWQYARGEKECDIFVFESEGIDENGLVTGTFRSTGHVPRFLEELHERGLEVNLGIFKH